MRAFVFTVTFLASGIPGYVLSNNIQVTNATLNGNNGTSVKVQFDLTWENSWRGGGVVNWDAAWVFVKFRSANGSWQHAQLASSGHSVPSSAQLHMGTWDVDQAYDAVSNPVVGVFISRATDGSGNFTASGIQLDLPYASMGFGFNDLQEVKVFAIEMVHVNQGAFYVGDGNTYNGELGGNWSWGYPEFGNPAQPYHITSEGPIPLGMGPGLLGGGGTILENAGSQLAISYPKGYRAFYCMKYEITQQQYVDFLNTLPRVLQAQRVLTDLGPAVTTVTNTYVLKNSSSLMHRNGVRCSGTIPADAPIQFICDLNGNGVGGEANDGLWVACDGLTMNDLMSYLDWSGLRPMTELEFEKACRGPLLPVSMELVYGATSHGASNLAITNSGQSNETISSGYSPLGNSHHIWESTAPYIDGPLRVGICAAHASNTGRVSSGASYYGIMDMQGNVLERTIMAIPGYIVEHGDGVLFEQNEFLQPSQYAQPRGWSWFGPYLPYTIYTMCSRPWDSGDGSYLAGFSAQRHGFGGRGVRTAP